MAHLKKAAGGHLLKSTDGHLVNDCGEIACNECDPPLEDTYTVQLSGLGGDFAPWNGTHEVPWYTGCTWALIGDEQVLSLYWTGYWRLTLSIGPTYCQIVFAGSSDACEPTGVYGLHECSSLYCPESDSCAKSAGAACEVS